MRQLSSNPSTKTISDLIGLINRHELILQPDFQRKLVWSQKHKEAFIETILKGYPFPEIYIAQADVDFETFKTTQAVVDGQQRLSTIIAYIEGALVCNYITKFSDLTVDEKTDFLNYDVVIRDLKNTPLNTIKEVFRRINQTHYGLTEIEINNAIYEGDFITTAKDILYKLNPGDFAIFSDTEISRMADLDYILMIMSTLEEGGYYAGNKMTQEYIVRYDEFYENADTMKTKVLSVFDIIRNLELADDSIWYRKSNFFTLFIEIASASNIPQGFKEKLISFEKNVIANKGVEQNDYGLYYSVMYTGTNSRNARLTRSDLFKKYCLQ